LTEWEVLKMKELYYWQLQELSGQFAAHMVFGWLLTYPLCGPILRATAHGWVYKLPIMMTTATFLGVQAANWKRPCKSFHEAVAQPAPHGSYLRRSLKVKKLY